MASYVGDFKRLHRSHVTQILRLRRTVPAMVVPRIVVSATVERESIKLNFSRSSGSSSDESKVSEDATHTNGRGTPTFLEFRVCSLPAVSTVAQIIAGVSLEHLTKHISTSRPEDQLAVSDFAVVHFTERGSSSSSSDHHSVPVPKQDQPRPTPLHFASGLFRSVFGSSARSLSESNSAAGDPGNSIESSRGQVSLTDRTGRYARNPLAQLEPLVHDRRNDGQASDDISHTTPSSSSSLERSLVPSMTELIPTQQQQRNEGSSLVSPFPRSPSISATEQVAWTPPQMETPTDGLYRTCHIALDSDFAKAAGLFSEDTSCVTCYLLLYSILHSSSSPEDTHVGGIPIAKSFSCLTSFDISFPSNGSSPCIVTSTRQVYSAGLINGTSNFLTPSIYYSTFSRLFQSSSVAGRRQPPQPQPSTARVAASPSSRNLDQHSINRRAFEFLSSRARRLLGTSLLHGRNLSAAETSTTMAGSLFSNQAPPPIAPTPDQWNRLVKLQEATDIFGLEADGENACLICMCNPKETVLLPCRHCSCCSECLKSLRQEKCPMCRSLFSSYVVFPLHKTQSSPSSTDQQQPTAAP